MWKTVDGHTMAPVPKGKRPDSVTPPPSHDVAQTSPLSPYSYAIYTSDVSASVSSVSLWEEKGSEEMLGTDFSASLHEKLRYALIC